MAHEISRKKSFTNSYLSYSGSSFREDEQLRTPGIPSPIYRSNSSSTSSSFQYPPPGRMVGGNDYQSNGNGRVVREMHGLVGFANIPNQLHRLAMKKGFRFTILVAGPCGTGKSTFMNSLFSSEICPSSNQQQDSIMKEDVDVTIDEIELVENQVHLSLTLLETAGFGGQIDNSGSWEKIMKHVDDRFEEYLGWETALNRASSPSDRTSSTDHRVHVCLYFIPPTGKGLSALDLKFLSEFSRKVNVIPIIAKADTLTLSELTRFKDQISQQIDDNEIKIYKFPDSEKIKNLKKKNPPFAVIGSNDMIESKSEANKLHRGRKYPWGTVNVDNPGHCDFTYLRELLLRYHTIDLIDVTNNVHYENYRFSKFSEALTVDINSNFNPFTVMDHERVEHADRLKQNERDMETVFAQKVAEKREKLKALANDLEQRFLEESSRIESRRRSVARLSEHLLKMQEENPGVMSRLSDGQMSTGSVKSGRYSKSGSPDSMVGTNTLTNRLRTQRSWIKEKIVGPKTPHD